MTRIRRIAAIAGALVSSVFASGVWAQTGPTQSVADIFRKLDLLGTWSVECARTPSRENPHFAVQQPTAPGPVQRQTLTGQATATTITTFDVDPNFDGSMYDPTFKTSWRSDWSPTASINVRKKRSRFFISHD